MVDVVFDCWTVLTVGLPVAFLTVEVVLKFEEIFVKDGNFECGYFESLWVPPAGLGYPQAPAGLG